MAEIQRHFIFHDIPEVHTYTSTNPPVNRQIKLIGVYCGRAKTNGNRHKVFDHHYLASYSEFRLMERQGQDQRAVNLDVCPKQHKLLLDFSDSPRIPRLDEIIEVWGTIHFNQKQQEYGSVLYVQFCRSLGECDVEAFLDCRRRQRKYVQIDLRDYSNIE